MSWGSQPPAALVSRLRQYRSPETIGASHAAATGARNGNARWMHEGCFPPKVTDPLLNGNQKFIIPGLTIGPWFSSTWLEES